MRKVLVSKYEHLPAGRLCPAQITPEKPTPLHGTSHGAKGPDKDPCHCKIQQIAYTRLSVHFSSLLTFLYGILDATKKSRCPLNIQGRSTRGATQIRAKLPGLSASQKQCSSFQILAYPTPVTWGSRRRILTAKAAFSVAPHKSIHHAAYIPASHQPPAL